MRILGFDTAAPTNTIGLVDDDRLLADYAWEARDNSLQRIVLNIDQVLKRGGIALQDIDGLAVGIGPGSWTGAKVGVTVAKTLAYAIAKPICGVTSLEALAYQSRTASVQTLPAGGCRQGERLCRLLPTAREEPGEKRRLLRG